MVHSQYAAQPILPDDRAAAVGQEGGSSDFGAVDAGVSLLSVETT